MRLLISFAALFLSVILLQLGVGGVAPLDALSGVELNFTKAEIGTLGSAHFFGFFIGCDNSSVAGVNTPYHSQTLSGINLHSTCNADCTCVTRVHRCPPCHTSR